ncbi:MAG: ABC transporter permease [Clostridia bacterium]|nr:ABC transporter permease [Clostridia bacterium]
MEEKTWNEEAKRPSAFKRAGRAVLRFFKKNEYIFSKIGFSLLTLALTTIFLFFLLRQIPGDIVDIYAQQLQYSRGLPYERAYELAVQLLNYNPNENIFAAFFRYVGGLLRGELGESYLQEGVSANLLIEQRLPWTLFISSVALFISFFLGVAIGGYVAQRRNGIANKIASGYIAVTGAIPDYLMALLMVTLFAYQLKIFPSQNNFDIFTVTPGFNIDFILNVLYHAALPILSSAIIQTGYWIMQMRGSCIGILGSDYIFSARARGLSERTIRKKYMNKNALLPLVASFGVAFGGLFGGSVLLESIFNYPGIGLEITARITSKDYVVVQGLVFFSAAMIIIVNLIVDLIYPLIDPRVKRG